MEAYQGFNSIIRNIKESQLKYSSSRTAFSVNILIKSSFLKRFSKESQTSEAGNWLRTNAQVDKNFNVLEEDDLKLKHAKVMGDLEGLKQVYDKVKTKSKALEEKTANYIEELLKIKNEKHELSKIYKVKSDELKALQAKTEALAKERVN